MRKNVKRIISLVLVIAIFFTSFELSTVVSEAATKVKNTKEEKKVKATEKEIQEYVAELEKEGKKWEENKNKRTEDTTTYELADGVEKTIFYSGKVRYKNKKGELKDYDSSLIELKDNVTNNKKSLNGYKYENKVGNIKNYFPSKVSVKTPVLLENDKYSVKLAPIENGENNKDLVDVKNLQDGEDIEEEIKDIYDKKESKKIGMKYKSKDKKLAYEYISSEQGVKENIILDEVPESNVFSFSMELDGIIAKKDKVVEGISFYDENEDIVGGIQIPYMNDASGKAYSEDISYKLFELENGKYRLDMIVSKEYLEDKERQYPVTVDPTISWTGTSYMYDTYIANNSYANDNFYSSSITLLRVGMLSSGSATTRSMVHWPQLKTTVNDKHISSAKLTLYETGTGASGCSVRGYRINQAWNKATVTWNTQPSIDTSYYCGFTTKGTTGAANTASCAKFVQDIANDTMPSYGLSLRNANEQTISKYAGYYNSRYTGNTAYRPKLEVTYVDRPSRPSSVTAAKSYLIQGNPLTVSWEGITGSNLSYVQYRILEYDPTTGTYGDEIIPYSSSTKIGTTSSGTATINAVNSFDEGYYRIFVRGVNTSGIAGVAVAKSFVVDGTAPVISSASISPSDTSETNYSTEAPTITWSASDTYFGDVQVSVDGSAYTRISTSASGSASLEDYITEPGRHVISLRVRDSAVNISSVRTFIYYYDTTMPTIGGGNITYDKEDNSATVQVNKVECGLSGLSTVVKYAITNTSSSEITDVSELNKTATITYTGNIGKFNLAQTDMNISDGIYNVYVSISDRSGHYSDVYAMQLFKFSSATYDGDEILSATYDKDNSVVKLSWNEDSDISSVDLYSRYGENGKFKFDRTITGAYEVSIATSNIGTQADYRLVVKYTNKQKLSSGITVVKQEEEDENGTTTVSYDMDSIDTDEDGLIDIYEMWELGTDIDNEDTDGDSFTDGYEVMSLGTSPSIVTADADYDNDGLTTSEELTKRTNPYLPDSDFDGYNDYEEIYPLGTDVSNQHEAVYTTDVHMGLYDRTVTETVDNATTSFVINIYSGITKKTVDAQGNQTAYFYDHKDNNTACIKYYDNQYIANVYTYDDNDNLKCMAKEGFAYNFEYDTNGNLMNIKIANRVLMNSTYYQCTDTETNESTYINNSTQYGNGAIYEYVYDSNNENITSIKLNGNVVYSMTYNTDGNMISQVDNVNNVTYTYGYDEDDNLISVSGSDGFSISNTSQTTESDEDSNTESVESGTITYSQDAGQRVCSYSASTAEEKNEITSVLINNAEVKCVENGTNNKTISIKRNNSTILDTTITPNDDGSLSISNNGEVLKYTYDSNSNITSIRKNESSIATYEYNSLEQLTRENDVASQKTITYQYDKGGNIVNKKIYNYTTGTISSSPLDTIQYEYNDTSWKDMLTKFDGQQITYDELGNPLNYRDGISFTWKEGRNVATVTNADNEVTSYKYNKDGVRVSKVVDGVETKYYVKDYDIIKEETNNDVIWYLYDGNSNLVGLEVEGNSYYYKRNIQNDVIGILDSTGTQLVTYSYDAYGNITGISGDEDLAELNPFRYRGYYYDKETGFYYLNSRYYDSKTGRFINADDANIAIIGSITNDNANLYAYCNNNPVKNNDNTGYWVSVDSVILGSVTAVTKLLTACSVKLQARRLTKAVNNYFYNKKKGKAYTNNKYNKKEKFIYGQESNKTVANLRFGFAKFAVVGCEIIAIYNALRMKGKNPNIAKIALELEINGGQMGFGYLGCNPKYIANYLKAHKIKYTKYTTKKTFKNSIAKGNVYIMSYWINNYGTINIKTYKDGIHTVMVKCEKVNEFHVYNDYNEAEGVEKYNSFEELLDGFKFVCGYKIR